MCRTCVDPVVADVTFLSVMERDSLSGCGLFTYDVVVGVFECSHPENKKQRN